MGSFNFLLRFEGPEVDFSWTHNNVVRDLVVGQRSQYVFRSIELAVNDSLNAHIVSGVPNFDHFICSEWYKMIPLLVYVKVWYGSVVTD